MLLQYTCVYAGMHTGTLLHKNEVYLTWILYCKELGNLEILSLEMYQFYSFFLAF